MIASPSDHSLDEGNEPVELTPDDRDPPLESDGARRLRGKIEEAQKSDFASKSDRLS